jgi:hypothetical protein
VTTTSTPSTGTTSAPLKSWPVYVWMGVTVALLFVLHLGAARGWRDLASGIAGADSLLVTLILAMPILDDSASRRLLQWWSRTSAHVDEAWQRRPRLAVAGIGVTLGVFVHTVVSHVPGVDAMEPKSDWWAWPAGFLAFGLLLPVVDLRHSSRAVKWRYALLWVLFGAAALVAWGLRGSGS